MRQPAKAVRLVGGGARSRFWAQMIADIVGVPMEIPIGAEFGAKGDHAVLEETEVAVEIGAAAAEIEERVADQLAGAVPGDEAAAVDVDDRGAVRRPVPGPGASARGVDGRVLQ